MSHIYILQSLGIFLLSLIILLFDNIYLLDAFYFWILIFFLIFDFFKRKKIELIHSWQVAFVYVILSEVFTENYFYQASDLESLKFLIIANNCILLGYLSKRKVFFTPQKNSFVVQQFNNKLFNFSILLMTFLFLFNIKDQIFISFFGGRLASDGPSNLINTILNTIGFVLPAIICYKYLILQKRSVFFPFLLSSPIFVVQFILGTRFPLLFSIIGFVIVWLKSQRQNNISNSKKILLMSLLILMTISTKIMRDFRAYGFTNYSSENITLFQENNKYTGVAEKILSFGSNEGVLKMTSLLRKHFENNEHLYGKSSSFILYFWVPRFIWPEKPTMLGYWIIRKYESGFGSGHSVSFGFTGDLYADFGYFSLIIILIIGRYLKKLDNYNDRIFSSNKYSIIISSMLYPFIFFFVRSPITSLVSLMSILFYFYLIKKIIKLK